MNIKAFMRIYRKLKISDIKKFKKGDKIFLAVIHWGDKKIYRIHFIFNKITKPKDSYKKYISYWINGTSKYTKKYPLWVDKKTGDIKFAQSSDESPIYILKPIKDPRTNRPSPSISATMFKIGTKRKGNDGNMWIVKKNKKGIQRWVRLSKGGGICKKVNDSKYKNRPSPPYHANDCKGKILLGNDKKYYVSRPVGNTYRWMKIRYGNSPWEYYKQFPDVSKPKYSVKSILSKLMKLRKDLYKNKIYMPILTWKNTLNSAEYKEMEVERILKPYSKNIWKNLSFIYFSPNNVYYASVTGKLWIQHNFQNKDKKKAISLFKKYFGKKYSWNGSKKRAILINIK